MSDDRKGNETDERYMGVASLSVRLGPGEAAGVSAAASPGRSPDKGGWVGEE